MDARTVGLYFTVSLFLILSMNPDKITVPLRPYYSIYTYSVNLSNVH